ncbi:MAG: DUF2156 domain-containing protein [Syntrophomonadaceae bacterium]|nr:DUF2156 domain-containing protein [Syntrophomonadaceae bacterium]
MIRRRFKHKPPNEHFFDRSYAAHLVDKHGYDSLAYLALEKDKSYFFGLDGQGFIAYIPVGKVAVCVGNPVCPPEYLLQLLSDFKRFCRQRKLKICFCSVCGELARTLHQQGYCISKYGEEALLDLCSYEMTGKKTLKLRQKIRRAEASGIKLVEYHPQEQRDALWEEQFLDVSRDWYKNKSGQLRFTLGELDFDHPWDRRFFAAMDEESRFQAILTFSPYNHRRGYYLDIMRKRQQTVPGVMEKAIIDAAMLMKSEGVEWVSLGLAPLAGIDRDNDKFNYLEKGMHFVYKNINQDYDFRSLHDYKRKFGPNHWIPRYVAYEKGLSPLTVGYAMIKARNVKGVWKKAFSGLWATRKG